MNSVFKTSIASLLLSVAQPGFAHQGHDHNHWSADLLHYGFYISLCAMIAVWMICLVRILTAENDNPPQSANEISPTKLKISRKPGM